MDRQTDRLLLTVEEAARRLGIGRTLAWRLVRRGELPVVRPGKCVRIPWPALQRTKREVQRKIRAAVTEAEQGILPARADLTVAAFLQRWLDDVVASGVSTRTRESYAYHVRLHLIPAIGQRKLRRRQAPDLQRLYHTLLQRGLSPKTVRNIHGVIRRAMGQAVKWQLVPYNVALAATPPRVERREYRTYDAAKVSRLWASVEGTRWKPFLVLAIKTGLRQGELLGLRWADIDFAAATLQVRRQLQRDKTFQPTKGRRNRRLDLGELELAALREHRQRHEERRRHWGGGVGRARSRLLHGPRPATRLARHLSRLPTDHLRRRGWRRSASTTCATPTRPYCSSRGSTRRWCRSGSGTATSA